MTTVPLSIMCVFYCPYMYNVILITSEYCSYDV